MRVESVAAPEGSAPNSVPELIKAAAKAAAKAAVELLPREWLNHAECAAYVGVSEQTLSTYLKAKHGPPSVLIARNARRFRTRDVDAWIAAGGAMQYGHGRKDGYSAKA
jgi:predicted DNA-binding transcriptional regulator AlpA